MIINKKDYSYQIDFNSNEKSWINNEKYYFLEDGSELAQKIIMYYPYIILNVVNDEIVEVNEDIATKEFEMGKYNITNEIKELKQKLSDTDYQAIKYAEGQLSEEEYQPIKEQRQAWRDKINELEELITESEVE